MSTSLNRKAKAVFVPLEFLLSQLSIQLAQFQVPKLPGKKCVFLCVVLTFLVLGASHVKRNELLLGEAIGVFTHSSLDVGSVPCHKAGTSRASTMEKVSQVSAVWAVAALQAMLAEHYIFVVLIIIVGPSGHKVNQGRHGLLKFTRDLTSGKSALCRSTVSGVVLLLRAMGRYALATL